MKYTITIEKDEFDRIIHKTKEDASTEAQWMTVDILYKVFITGVCYTKFGDEVSDIKKEKWKQLTSALCSFKRLI